MAENVSEAEKDFKKLKTDTKAITAADLENFIQGGDPPQFKNNFHFMAKCHPEKRLEDF